jgi:DHA2 family metal-tetracycline-proton antiporter-like MFS transporter
LILNVAASIGIAYTAAMMDNTAMKVKLLGYINNSNASLYRNVLFVLAFLAVFSLFLYWVLVGRKMKMAVSN